MPIVSSIDELYARAFGRPVEPFPFQRRLADTLEADVMIAPTGLGKTAAVTLAWAWRRLTRPDATPRRLIWCLPMRTLVEQTAREAREWMERLSDDFVASGQVPATVFTIMGGAVDNDWRLTPEAPAILVGTQDMLLSRALMRGYGMSRFGWPIDFGFLHTDALWVFDEVQLMGTALATSAQLEAFRRRAGWRQHGLARSLWVSATLDPSWLATAEFRSEVAAPVTLRWDDGSAPEPTILTARLDALKNVSRAQTVLTLELAKKPDAYAAALAAEVRDEHRPGATTVVILNTVRRAQAVYRRLREAAPEGADLLLVHSRFRPPERRLIEQQLREESPGGRIVVATQAIEAGVDMTSAVLFTELAPWSSLVQRFGRCNRGGEWNARGGAEIRWIDLETAGDPSTARPYETDDLQSAREIVSALVTAAPRTLPPPSPPKAPTQVIRPKDFEELFDTDADLSGFDLDISPYIREADEVSVSLFWRPIGENGRLDTARPTRDELCSAPLGDVRAWLERKSGGAPIEAFVEDVNGRARWAPVDRRASRLRPGVTLLLDLSAGGYDPQLGFWPESRRPVEPIAQETPDAERGDETAVGAQTDEDAGSRATQRAVRLDDHLRNVAAAATDLCRVLQTGTETPALVRAAAWHDAGKAHAEFQRRMGNADRESPDLAKSVKYRPPERDAPRRFFRHELASALAFLAHHDGEPDADLCAFLIAAHHGKVRMGIRSLPDERGEPPETAIARGVQDGDLLPEVVCGDETSPATRLSLDLMRMGDDDRGRPSWTGRTQALLARYGPFRLAYLEALVRMADWRASRDEQRPEADNG